MCESGRLTRPFRFFHILAECVARPEQDASAIAKRRSEERRICPSRGGAQDEKGRARGPAFRGSVGALFSRAACRAAAAAYEQVDEVEIQRQRTHDRLLAGGLTVGVLVLV